MPSPIYHFILQTPDTSRFGWTITNHNSERVRKMPSETFAPRACTHHSHIHTCNTFYCIRASWWCYSCYYWSQLTIFAIFGVNKFTSQNVPSECKVLLLFGIWNWSWWQFPVSLYFIIFACRWHDDHTLSFLLLPSVSIMMRQRERRKENHMVCDKCS